MIDTIILAAGKSSRMDGFKPLLPWGNITIIEKVIETAKKVSDRIIVVVGHNKEKIISKIQNLNNVYVVENINYENGMFSSIFVGIKHVKSARFFLALGDQPHIEADVYKKLLKEKGEVVIPSYNQKGGHPILLSDTIKAEILKSDILNNSVSLRDILKNKVNNYVEINDIGVLLDIDYKEDYIKVSESYL